MFRRMSHQICKHILPRNANQKEKYATKSSTSAVVKSEPKTKSVVSDTTEVKPVGFIGCGTMGSLLVKNLIKKGTQVICYDRKPKPREIVKEMGATVVGSSAEVAELVDIMFTLLPDFKSIIYCIEGKDGVLSTGKTDLIVCDLSTVGPVNVLRIDMSLEEQGIKFISAPLSGGTRTQSLNTLVFTVGGKASVLRLVEPYLIQMASKGKEKVVFHIGEHIGDGQSARICNILLASVCMVGTAEVMNLGIKLGVDPKVLAQAMNSSSGQCWACEDYNPVPGIVKHSPASDNYEGGETIYVLLKSIGIAQNVAAMMFTPIPACSIALQMYAVALARGYAEKDFSAIYQIYKQSIISRD